MFPSTIPVLVGSNKVCVKTDSFMIWSPEYIDESNRWLLDNMIKLGAFRYSTNAEKFEDIQVFVKLFVVHRLYKMARRRW